MGLLSSPRRRRRAVRFGVAAAVLALVFLGVHFSNPGNPGNANGPLVNEDNSQPRRAPFTKQDRKAVHAVLREFVLTAVDRRDVGRSWEISAPSLREGFTRKQWTHGNLPVVPYPAANRGLGDWSFVQYSYQGLVGLEVFLFPKPGSGWSAMTADVELVKGHDGRWRVDYWMPKRFHGPPSLSTAAKAQAKAKARAGRAKAKRARPVVRRKAAAPAPAPAPATAPPRPSRLWWAVPIALLALIVIAPLGIATVIWLRNRRSAREWATRT
ncbi:MAG TPA: hypothetical protein VGP56_07940 [Gaiellaceae bacterium]|nr:hypothetical protein [Gaiellaceae bacterium]